MKRVLVTGAAGFLGTHLTNALTARGDRAFVLYRTVQPHPLAFERPEELTQLMGDVQEQPFVRRILSEYEIDAVVHLAAQTQVSVGASNPEAVIRENVNGAISVLEACRLQGTKRVVIASTDKVYGESEVAYVEETPLLERNPYGASKACVDMIAQTYLHAFKLPVAITRCGNLYGPGHINWSTLIPGTIRRMHRGEKPILRFGGKAVRDFLYVSDAVRAYLALIDSDDTGPFNFSGGEPYTILKIVSRLGELMGWGGGLDIREEGVGEIKWQALNCKKAERQLRWTPDVGMGDGLRRTVAWYRDHLKTA